MQAIWIGIVIHVFGAAAGVGRVQEKDQIGTKKASSILPKAVKEVLKKEGYRLTEKIAITGFQDQGADFQGQARKKKYFAAVTGTAEVYAKGTSYLARSGDQFFPPDKLSGEEGARAGMFRNPALFLFDLRKMARTAKWGEETEVDGHACMIAELFADERTLKGQIKEFSGNLGELKQYGVLDITPYIDVKRSTSRYSVSVGNAELLIYRIEWDLTLVIKKNSIPPGAPITIPDKVEVKVEMVLSGFDEELELDLPKVIQRWSGVKN